MKKLYLLFPVFLVFFIQQTFSQGDTISNNAYWAEYNSSINKIRIVNKEYKNDTIDFATSFHVLVNSNPATPTRVVVSENIKYYTTAWKGNTDLYSAGTDYAVEVQSATIDENKLLLSYDSNDNFSFTAELEIPNGEEFPKLKYSLIAKESGGYSVCYAGCPKCDSTQIDELWQPLIWTEKKFPKKSYLTLSYHTTLPSSMVTQDGITYGVIADPDMYPFELLPTFARSDFGVALRNSDNQAQPMIWSPVMGKDDSELASGDSTGFTIRLFAGRKSIQSFYEELSLDLYGFAAYDRDNVLGSLNKTLDNMIDYGMSTYSRFNDSAKGPSYETDIPGAVKVTSSLNPLNIAYVTDNDTIFRKRAKPMMEFLLSRSNTTYADEETSGTGQTAYNTLGEPAMNFSEITALYSIFKGHIPFLLDLAEEKSINFSDHANERQWRQYIAMYRATEDESYLSNAEDAADDYIADRIDSAQTSFNFLHHSESSFWVQLAPKFVDLLELYEVSGEQKYLDAAHTAARRFAMFTWMSPKIPDEDITVNSGNEAPVYASSGGDPISVPEESVPAWRLSNFGMHPEAAATAISHRSVFMAHHAPYFLKIGQLTNDDYLIKIAKSAIIGRSRNFPGYHINTDRTTVYEKLDFPLRDHDEISSTSMHYNHVWPMMSLLLDYLVSDANTRSEEQIYFPSEFVEAFANLQSRIYGHKPGSFYNIDSVTLWMPQGLLDIESAELNYISARRGDTLLIAFTNQSSSDVSTQVTLNSARVMTRTGTAIDVIENNSNATSGTISGNSFPISVSGNGITAVIIKNVDIETSFQEKVNSKNDTAWENDYLEDSVASIRAMFLNMGDDLSEAYIFSTEEKGTYTSLTLRYSIDGADTVTITDVYYPFEFEIGIPSGTKTFYFTIEAVDESGNLTTSDNLALSKYSLVKASISGDKYILPEESADLFINLEGTPPWNIVYNNGTTNDTISGITSSPFGLTVQPGSQTTYTLVSVSDSISIGLVDGESTVYLLEDAEEPVFDGMIRQQQQDGVFDLTYAQIKESSNYARDAFFSFDLTQFDRKVKKAAFRLYLYKDDKTNDAGLQITGIGQGFNNSLTWLTQPDDSEFSELGQYDYHYWETPGYVSWEITDYCNQMIDSVERFSLKVSEQGSDALLYAYTSENESFVPVLLYTLIDSTKTTQNTYASSYSSTNNSIEVYPNPAKNSVSVMASENMDQIILIDMQGKAIEQCTIKDTSCNLDLSKLNPGFYFLKIYSGNDLSMHKLIIR